MTPVAIYACDDYDYETVKKTVNQMIASLGGLSIVSGQTVLIKANLIAKAKPEAAVTTHPSFVQAVAEHVIALGANVIVADSAGGLFNATYMNPIYEATGMRLACQRSHATLNQNFETVEVAIENGKVLKKCTFCQAMVQADAIINIAKFKTHTFAGYTGAVKNLYGTIPGLKKVEYHGTHTQADKFCDLLIDIEQYFRNKVIMHFVDAVVAMEGQGPTSGTPILLKRLAASRCPYCVDAALIVDTNENPDRFPLFQAARERNMFHFEREQLAEAVMRVGDLVKVKNFHYPVLNKNSCMGKGLVRFVVKHSAQRPVISKRKCMGCKKCVEHCPPKAITLVNHKAVINLDRCIRCFCCQELCPYHVVKIKTPLLVKLYRKLK